MSSFNLSKSRKARVNRKLSKILTVGLSGSILLHCGLIAGAVYWWRPIIDVEEPMAITLVEPVDITVNPPARSAVVKPIVKQNHQPKVIPSKPIARPIIAKISSKKVSIQPPAIPRSKPQSIDIKLIPKPQPKSNGKSSSLSKFLVTEPTPKKTTAAIPTPIPTPIFNPPLPAVQKSKNLKSAPAIDPPPVTTPIDRSRQPPRSISSSPPIKRSETNSIEPIRAKPHSIENRQPQSNLAPNPIDTSANPQSQPVASEPNPIDRSNHSSMGRHRKITNNLPIDNQPTGVTPSQTERVNNSTNLPDNSRQNGSNIQRGGGSNPAPNIDNRERGNPAPNTAQVDPQKSNSGSTKLACIKYCEIPKLKDLQDTDGGKDRLQIRIVVDANGAILDASIVKSSGNTQIDSVVLEGIQKMQLSPPGKEIRGIVRANILIRSAKTTVIYSIA